MRHRDISDREAIGEYEAKIKELRKQVDDMVIVQFFQRRLD